MKKILFTIVAILIFTFNAYAQQGYCVVKDGNGASVTITVVDTNYEGDVDLSVSSDCAYPVSVNYTLDYEILGKTLIAQDIHRHKVTSQAFNVLAQPNQSNTVRVKVRDLGVSRDETYVGINVTKVNISGTRCEK